jgi:hypothetical protein
VRADEPTRAPSSEDVALAEALFREGRTLLEGGQVDAACTKLEGSQKLDSKISTLLNLAACHEAQGRTASAWAEFLEAARLTRVTPVRDPKALEATARARAEALGPRIHRLAIEKPDALPRDLELAVDGRSIPRAAWGTPIPVDPGDREIVAKQPRHAPWTRKMAITGDVRTHSLVIPALADLPDVIEVPGEVRFTLESRAARLTSAPFLVGAGIAVLGAGVGSYFGLRAIALKGERDDECDASGCSDLGLSKQNQAGDAAIASSVSFAVAAVGAGFALFWWLRPLSLVPTPATSPIARPAATSATAACLPGACTFSVKGTF